MGNTVRVWLPTAHAAFQGLPSAGTGGSVAANPRGVDCYRLCEPRSSLPEAAARTSQLDLMGPGDRYLLGLLVRTIDGQMILGATTYFAGHQGLASTIARCCGEITTFQWGGELLMQGHLGSGHPTLRINGTSGYLHHYRGSATVQHCSDISVRILTDSNIGLLPQYRAEVVPYDPGHEHLDPILSGIPGNFRHTFGAKFMIVGGTLTPIITGANIRRVVAALLRDFPTDVAALQALIEIVVRDEPARVSQFHQLSHVLTSVRANKVLSKKAYALALTEMEVLQTLYMERCLRDHDNIYDVYVLAQE